MSLEDRLNYWALCTCIYVCSIPGVSVSVSSQAEKLFTCLEISSFHVSVSTRSFGKSKVVFNTSLKKQKWISTPLYLRLCLRRSYLYLQHPLYPHLRLSKSKERCTPLRASVLSASTSSILIGIYVSRAPLPSSVLSLSASHLRIYASTFIRRW